MLHPDHVELLISFFKVRTNKVKERCDENYIRMDKRKNYQTNIDPLLDTLTSKDRERDRKKIKKIEKERKIRKIVPWGPSHARTAFDRGYDSGRASVRRGYLAEIFPGRELGPCLNVQVSTS